MANKKVESKVKWTREAPLALIEVYKNKPCLYNIKSVEHRNREKARDAQEDMMNAVKLFIPEITTEDCIKKCHSLRNQFRKDNQFYESSKNKSGAGTDDIIEPKLWCYKDLEFLKDHIKQREGNVVGVSSSLESPECSETQEVEETEDSEDCNMLIEYLQEDEEIFRNHMLRVAPTTPKATPSTSQAPSTTSSSAKRELRAKNVEEQSSDVADVLCSYLRNKSSQRDIKKQETTDDKEDRAGVFAAYVARRLRNLKNMRNVVCAEIEINNILNKYELKELE